jgi:hypothetical protein
MFKKKYLLFFSLFILGVLLITSCLLKPPVTEGILKGRVMVPEGPAQAKQLTGQALVNAIVNIIDPLTGDIIATTTTDANGYYRVFVLAGGPYILQAVKEGMKVQQVTPQVEVGEEYDLGTADCTTTAVALIFQAMLEDDSYPDNPADINLADIEANPDFDDVSNFVCGVLGVGEDPAVSAVVQQAVEDFLHPPTPTPLSDAKAITAFGFAPLDPDVVGVINEEAKTIALTVPFGTDVTALVPTIVHTGASVSPASGAAQDFTSPVNYTVTAEDTSTQAYVVTVTVAPSSAKAITAFSFQGLTPPVVGTVNEGAKTIALTVPNETVVTALVATFTNSAASAVKVGAVAQVSGTTANNFTSPVVYLVTAEDLSTVTYTVTVTVAPSADATISAGTLAGVALAGDFAGGANIGASSALTVTVPDASKTNAALALTKGNANSIVKYVKGTQPANDAAYTNTYTAGSTQITVANADVIWLLVTAENGTTKKYYKVTVTVLVVGQSYGGGIVAYIDGTGVHGLIAATADQSTGTGIRWYNGSYTTTGATATALGTGLANTNTIIAVQGATTTSYAAGLARAYSGGGYSDWYLPSKDELNQLFLNKGAIGGFAVALYWSSSEYNASIAWSQGFSSGTQYYTYGKNSSNRVRATRAF